LNTPSKKIYLILLTVAYWVVTPFLEAYSVQTEFARHGIHLWNYKTLSVHISRDILQSWLYASPFLWLFAWWALRKYPGRVFLFSFNNERPIFGGFFWFLTLAHIITSLIFALQSIERVHPIDVVDSLFGCYLNLLYNAVLQARKTSN